MKISIRVVGVIVFIAIISMGTSLFASCYTNVYPADSSNVYRGRGGNTTYNNSSNVTGVCSCPWYKTWFGYHSSDCRWSYEGVDCN